ncbi:MAG TPA: hypothetical protein VLE23_10540 [Geminicoccaceae bacterium]|nr:hypothetical protein [Geminicoccaceae bacterium]
MTRHRPRTASRLALLTFGALWLGACDPRDNPAWTLGGEPGLLFVLKQYYELNAREEGGTCASPLMEGVTSSRVVEEGEDRLTVELGYYYRDMVRDGDDCGRFRLLRCGVMRECQGFAARSFVVERQADSFRVVEMGGDRKGRIWQPPPLRERSPSSSFEN